MSKGANDSYLVERNKTWHYRRRVPDDIQPLIGQKFWKKSLKTAAKREAEAKARALGAEHDQLISRLRSLSPADKIEALRQFSETLRQGSDLKREQLWAKHCELRDRAASAMRAFMADPSPRTAKAQSKAISAFAGDPGRKATADKILVSSVAAQTAITAAANRNSRRLSHEDQETVRKAGGVETFLKLIEDREQDLQMMKADLVFNELAKSPIEEIEEKAAVIKTRERHAARSRQTLVKLGLATEDESYEEPDNPRIKTAMEKWFLVRKQGTYALKRHRISINRFVEMFGNVPVGAVTKQMVRAYIEKLEELPDNRRLPAKMRGRMVEADEDIPRISAPTIDRHLTTIKALLTFCVEREWLAVNVATGLRAPKDTRSKSSKRRPFSRDERRQLLARAKAEDTGNSDMPWFIQIVAYTGARLEEIAQLSVDDIREIDSVWVVDVHDLNGNNLKTEDSVKQVPLHPAIRDEFVAWAKSRVGNRLFKSFDLDKDGRYSKNVSGKVGRLMDRAGLSDPTLVLHSLRHTLKREMSNAGIDPDVRRVILGHAPKDAHDRYASHSLEAVAKEFAKMPALF